MSNKRFEIAVGEYVASFQAKKYLIVGASPIYIVEELIKHSKNISIIDIRPEKIGKLKTVFKNSVEYFLVKEGDEFSFFRDETFDLVVFYDVLHHFPDKERVIPEAKRVLRNNGHAFFAEPNISSKLRREYDQFGVLKHSMYKNNFISLLKKNLFEVKKHAYSDFVSSHKNGTFVRHYCRKVLQRLSIDPLFRIYLTVRKNQQ